MGVGGADMGVGGAHVWGFWSACGGLMVRMGEGEGGQYIKGCVVAKQV